MTQQSVKVVEDTGFVAQWSSQLADRERSSKLWVREPSQAYSGSPAAEPQRARTLREPPEKSARRRGQVHALSTSPAHPAL